MIQQILHRVTGAVLFECEVDASLSKGMRLGVAVMAAIIAGSNLSGSDLRGSDLSGSDLSGLKIIDGGLRSDGYRYLAACLDDRGWRRFAVGT